ncbi:sn-glycerol-1-phosphate dehydrogenase [Prevotella sp. A2931]|uniref:Sn-glycerol-1-phosphate dehydrogenase n=1 Tax=Prevotella illustrans TaxID=2800387 RepID=A0ABS3M375_9BACT|nr:MULTISPECIES: sn-glycerol-1-phosphate dehydrogenase [Prevotella]MBO1362632.1 sn-glycerol-1-phosphate dehydrogenase [Prevotella illustrans]PTL25196.1 3-dehydroquinate synthase [Prevotella sp. oral taxon 820]
MSKSLDLALEKATQTYALVLRQGAIKETARVFRDFFPGKRAVVIADKTTYDVAGNAVDTMLRDEGIPTDVPVILDYPDMHAEWKYIEILDGVLAGTDAIPIAVGSGTVNDLTKLSSYHNNRRYMVVATAASMDGYIAFGASITKDGCKTTFPCTAPIAIIADIDIISRAPADMTASGYADLFAKIPAGADWLLADAIGVEPIDPVAFSIAQDGLHDALSNPQGAREGCPEDIAKLMEGLLLGGFAMQAYPKSSRPASGADHQFSHLLNMQHYVMADGKAPSHGFQVALGTLASLFFYRELLKTDVEGIDVEACVKAWPGLEEQEQEAVRMFQSTDFPMLGATEVKAKYVDHDSLRRELTTFKEKWPETRRRLECQLIPVEEAIRRLRLVGAPTQPEDIGLNRRRMRDSVILAQKIRRRYTILDQGLRMCLLDKWTDALFGKGGIWEIK